MPAKRLPGKRVPPARPPEKKHEFIFSCEESTAGMVGGCNICLTTFDPVTKRPRERDPDQPIMLIRMGYRSTSGFELRVCRAHALDAATGAGLIVGPLTAFANNCSVLATRPNQPVVFKGGKAKGRARFKPLDRFERSGG